VLDRIRQYDDREEPKWNGEMIEGGRKEMMGTKVDAQWLIRI